MELNTISGLAIVGVICSVVLSMGSIAVFGIIYYFVTLLPDGEGGR